MRLIDVDEFRRRASQVYPEYLENVLDDMPTVDTDLSEYSDRLWQAAYERGKAEARKKGKWIYEGIRGRFPTCRCSVCGSLENADWAVIQGGANFCPNCGAYMGEEMEDAIH